MVSLRFSLQVNEDLSIETKYKMSHFLFFIKEMSNLKFDIICGLN